jgi:hypothetical protein
MANRHVFPREGSLFNEYVTRCAAYLIKFQARLQVSDDNLYALITLMDKWTANWKLYIDIDTQTKTVNEQKDNLRKLLEVALRDIYADIPASILLVEDKTTFNIKGQSTKKGSKIKVVDYAPSVSLETNIHLSHILRFQDPTRPESSNMPEGHNIFLERFVGEPNLIVTDISFANGMKVTHQLYQLIFTEDNVGKTCYYRSYYENTSGERSIQSRIINVVIS